MAYWFPILGIPKVKYISRNRNEIRRKIDYCKTVGAVSDNSCRRLFIRNLGKVRFVEISREGFR